VVEQIFEKKLAYIGVRPLVPSKADGQEFAHSNEFGALKLIQTKRVGYV
jgi:hypothetical protein